MAALRFIGVWIQSGSLPKTLKYYRTFNPEQREPPQAALDRLPKIEARAHDPIAPAERIGAGTPDQLVALLRSNAAGEILHPWRKEQGAR